MMDYGQEDCAQIIPKEVYLKQQAAIRGGSALGVAAAMQETELSSILTTLAQQAYEVRGIASSILQRVSPQLPDECAEKQCFSSGYVGRAEEIRSTLSEAIRLLGTLSKLA